MKSTICTFLENTAFLILKKVTPVIFTTCKVRKTTLLHDLHDLTGVTQKSLWNDPHDIHMKSVPAFSLMPSIMLPLLVLCLR